MFSPAAIYSCDYIKNTCLNRVTIISVLRHKQTLQLWRICMRSSFDYIYLKLCHWETWLPPRVLETLPPPNHKVQFRLVRQWTAQRFSTVWFWTISSGTRGPLRTWTPPLWGECRRLLKATSRRWSRGEWRAAPSSRSWPVWAVRNDTNIILQLLSICVFDARPASYFITWDFTVQCSGVRAPRSTVHV